MIRKNYKRMTALVMDSIPKDEVISRRSLQRKLEERNLLELFEKIYREDNNLQSCWHFFDFSDRFTNFMNQLVNAGYVQKVDRGKYIILQ